MGMGDRVPQIPRHILAPEIGIKRYDINQEIISVPASKSAEKPPADAVYPPDIEIPAYIGTKLIIKLIQQN